jgi:hypothetical protein
MRAAHFKIFSYFFHSFTGSGLQACQLAPARPTRSGRMQHASQARRHAQRAPIRGVYNGVHAQPTGGARARQPARKRAEERNMRLPR